MSTSSTRRQFLKTASAGAAAWSMSAASYKRVAGANDRISIAMIGCGSRGIGAHMNGVHKHDEDQNVEFTAVCDPWRVKREEAAALVKEWYGIEARQFVSYRDVMALDDVDAVMIASCDHQHTRHLTAAAKANKDAYCEKPLAMDFEKLKSTVDAVKDSGIVVQIGTQLRSMPSMTGAKEVFESGKLGNVARIEQHRNSSRPYWYGYVKEVKKEDVDWEEFLMDAPMRPFDPVQYSGWYGYLDFSDGPIAGVGSHYLDLIHYITGAKYPESAVSQQGVFTWKDENNFTCPDHAEALWIYPEGFMATYSTNFGNGSGNSFKMFGNSATLDLVDWNTPKISPSGVRRENASVSEESAVEPVSMPDHYLDWLQCLRDRKAPNAPIEAGYQHGVACLLAKEAFKTGRRQIYDPEKREMHAG